jgi:type IV pilus biogenesis protein CpaD/CtpE
VPRRTIFALVAVIALSACATEDQTEEACQLQYQVRVSITRLEYDEYVNQTETLKDLSQRSSDSQLRSLGETINGAALQWKNADYGSGDLLILNLDANQSFAERCDALGYQQDG